MTKQEIAHFEAIARGMILLIDNDTLLMTLLLYAPLKPKYKIIFDKIYACMVRQYQLTGQIAIDKKLLRKLMISTIYQMALRASVQAFNLGETEIQASLNKSITFLTKGKDADAILHCRALLKIMSDNHAILTILLPADITSMEDVIENFNDISVKPIKAIKDRKAEGFDPLPGFWEEMDIIEKQCGKLFQSYLPDFFVKWKDDLKIGIPTGRRRTSLVIKYVDANTNSPLYRIKSIVTRGDIVHKKTSTKIGGARFLSLDAGKYTITSEHPLYITDIKTNVGITDTSIARLEIRLKAKETTGTLALSAFDKDTNAPLRMAMLTVPKLQYIGKTNDFGALTKSNIAPGTYEGTITLEGYRPITFTFTIELNKTLTLDFYMERLD